MFMDIIMSILLSVVVYISVNSAYMLYFDKEEISLKKVLFCGKECCAAAAAAAVFLGLFGIYQGSSIYMYDYIRCVIIITALAFLAVVDYKERIIPNKILAVLFLIWLLITAIFIFKDIQMALYKIFTAAVGGAFAFFAFGITYIVSKKMLGAGDVKLAVIMGIYLGAERIFGAVLYGAVLSALFSIIGLISKKLTKADNIPFAPFLFIGALITLFVKV